jgi:predicted metalloprotease
MHRHVSAAPLVAVVALAAIVLASCASSVESAGGPDPTLKPRLEVGDDPASSTTSPDGSTSNTTGPDGATTTAPVDPDDPTGSTTTSPLEPAETTTTTPGVPVTLDDIAAIAMESIDDFWQREYPDTIGGSYSTIADLIAVTSNSDSLSCAGEDVTGLLLAGSGNALYCPDGDYIAYDAEGLIPTLFDEIGDTAVLVVLAHEWGHAIAARAGFDGPTIGLEQQADCFAGAWVADVDAGTNPVLTLDHGDLDEALTGLLEFRDPPGFDPQSEGAHGSAFQRIEAFRQGFEDGATACLDLHTRPPIVEGTDAIRSGDLPFETLIPFTLEALDQFWIDEQENLGGPAYEAFETESFRGSRSVPRCDGLTDDQIAGHVVYCEPSGSVLWDVALLEKLYRDGDFTVSALIGNAWSAGVLDRLGVEADARTLGLAADCLTGSWAAWFGRTGVDFEDEPIVLAAGDLDEAVIAFLVSSGTAGADEMFDESMTSAFERTSAFQNGFENGSDTCLP